MIILLSPAKSLNTESRKIGKFTLPSLISNTSGLIGPLRKLKKADLQNLMGISDALATENYRRFRDYRRTHTTENSKTAIHVFMGDVYRALAADQFDESDLHFAQDHLRILSGLYGILKPLDLIQPYRLEMGTRLKTKRGNNLYAYWDDRVTKALNRELNTDNTDLVVNLASNEYFKVLQPKRVKAKILTINFKEYRDGELKFLSFNAKRARGLMAHFIIKNKINKEEDLKGFDTDGYTYNDEISTNGTWIFVR